MSNETNAPRTALILGASGTLGGAIARALHGHGYSLGLHAHCHPENLPELSGAHAYTADFREGEQIKALVKGAVKDLGRLDVLIWAAGISRDAPVLTQSDAEVREVLAVDLSAPFLLAKAAARAFIKQKAGHAIFLSSHAALGGRAGGAAYAMAQSGLLALVKSLAREWGPTGVRVNAVVPPFVADSAMGRGASAQFADAVRARNVFAGEADPAAATGAFVAHLAEHPGASGQVFTVDARIHA